MSEYLNFDADGYPSFVVPMGDEKVEGTPENTTVYLHGAEYKGVDHIFVRTEYDDEGRSVGPFLWRIISRKFSDEGMFDAVVEELIANDFEVEVKEVPHPSDLAMFEDYINRHVVTKITNKGIKKWLQTTD